MNKLEQKLSLQLEKHLQLEKQKVLEAEQLKKLECSRIIFQTTTAHDVVVGILEDVGEHYLFLEDVKVLAPYDLERYISREKLINDKDNIKFEEDFGVYNKRDISEIYSFPFK